MTYAIDEPVLMEQARRALAQRIARDGRFDHDPTPLRRPCPECPTCTGHRKRSLQQRCLPAKRPARALRPTPRETGAYVPELAERLERDERLSDGARRCARIIGGYEYRRQRESRTARITVSYLAMVLGRCRRTVQDYLRQLEAAGYIETRVILSGRTRMCVGLFITLLKPLLPRHRWPERAMKRDAQFSAHKYRTDRDIYSIPRTEWWDRCRNGLDRVLIALAEPPSEGLRL